MVRQPGRGERLEREGGLLELLQVVRLYRFLTGIDITTSEVCSLRLHCGQEKLYMHLLPVYKT